MKRQRKSIYRIVGIFLLLTLATQTGWGQIPITDCIEITTPGNYILTNDIVYDPWRGLYPDDSALEWDCIKFLPGSEGSTLDCQGYTIAYDGIFRDGQNRHGRAVAIYTNNITVENGAFSDNYQGAYVLNTQNTLLQNLKINNVRNNGIELLSADSSIIWNCQISGSSQRGIRINSSNNVNMTGNVIVSNLREGIWLRGSYITIENNIINNNGLAAIRLSNTNGCVIANNTFENNYRYGVIDSVSTNNILIGNFVEGSLWGLTLRNADNYVIQYNEIIGATPSIIVTSCTNSLVLGNECKGGGGIVVNGLSTSVTVENNEIKDGIFDPSWPASNSGIHLSGVNNNLLNDNEITNMQGDGMLLEDADDNIVENNEIKYNTGAGINQDPVSIGNIFINNEIKDNAGGDTIGL